MKCREYIIPPGYSTNNENVLRGIISERHRRVKCNDTIVGLYRLYLSVCLSIWIGNISLGKIASTRGKPGKNYTFVESYLKMTAIFSSFSCYRPPSSPLVEKK